MTPEYLLLVLFLPLVISAHQLFSESNTKSISNPIFDQWENSNIQRFISLSEANFPDVSPSSSEKNVDINSRRLTRNNGIYDGFLVKLKRKSGETKDYNKHRQRQKVEGEVEVECSQTMYMSPFHLPVAFSLNSSIYSRADRTCKWNFIGSEPCIPKLTCTFSPNPRDCSHEYMEIVDGGEGYVKVCGTDNKEVDNISATSGMRDLYIHYKVIKPPKEKRGSTFLFNCTVVCSRRNEGTPLTKYFQPKFNPKCFCGTKPNEDRIVGGESAKKFEFPWLVALVETNTRQPFCGGSIINNRFILTAAHCIQGKFMDYRNLQVVANGHEFDQSFGQISNIGPAVPPKIYPLKLLEKMDQMNGSRRYNIEEIIIHPLYVVETNDFDVALLKLQEDINLTPKPRGATQEEPMDSYSRQPRSVCLPELGSYSRTYSNKKATVAGWGLPSAEANSTVFTLQKIEVKIFSPQVCKELYSHRVNRRMLCAGIREGGKDSCAGDSGGPLVTQEKKNMYAQVGAVSWGEGCGEKDHPGVYFRVTEGLQWIHYHSNYNGARDDDAEDIGGTWCMTPP